MYENELACAIARAHFGGLVAEVTRVLLCHPSISLLEIGRRCGDPYKSPSVQSLRDALAVLLAHGAAVAERGEVGHVKRKNEGEEVKENGVKERQTVVTYRIVVLQLFLRCRFSLYLGLAHRQFGELGKAVLRALFERGRLTAMQIFKVALDPVMETLQIDDGGAQHCLTDMARVGLLKWCGNRREGLPSTDTVQYVSINGEMEDCNGSKKRKREDDSSDDDNALQEPAKDDFVPLQFDKIRVGRGDSCRIVGAPSRENDQDVWRVSYWYLNRGFRNECCKFVVASRVQDRLALEVLITGLNLALYREDADRPTDDVETSEITTEAVQRQLAENDVAISERDFWGAIRLLVSLSPPCVKAIPEHAPTKLKFIPGRLVAEVRQQTLEDMIMHKYKKAGRRVFRALAIDGCMEDKMLAEKCMLDVKMVREKLFSMYNDRLISMQEVPRSHDQQRANNWYYLWRVRPHDVYKCFLNVMYKTQTNLLLKLQHLETSDVGDDETSQKLRQGQRSLLAASMMRVDQSIMVMRDFGPFTASFFPSRYKIIEAPMGRPSRRR